LSSFWKEGDGFGEDWASFAVRRKVGEDLGNSVTIGARGSGEVLGLVEVFLKAGGDEAVVAGGPSAAIPSDGIVGWVKEADFVPKEAAVIAVVVSRRRGLREWRLCC